MTTGAGAFPSVGCTLRVGGRLDGRWAAWFDGFTLTADADGTTTLSGVVADQAQLHGLLAKVRDLGLPLISLETGAVTAPAVESCTATVAPDPSQAVS